MALAQGDGPTATDGRPTSRQPDPTTMPPPLQAGLSHHPGRADGSVAVLAHRAAFLLSLRPLDSGCGGGSWPRWIRTTIPRSKVWCPAVGRGAIGVAAS